MEVMKAVQEIDPLVPVPWPVLGLWQHLLLYPLMRKSCYARIHNPRVPSYIGDGTIMAREHGIVTEWGEDVAV